MIRDSIADAQKSQARLKEQIKRKVTVATRMLADPHSVEVQCCYLSSKGLYTKAIANRLGLSESEVQYRLRIGGGSKARREYRSGESDVAERIMRLDVEDIVYNDVKRATKKFQKGEPVK
jgi:hypothetical protein